MNFVFKRIAIAAFAFAGIALSSASAGDIKIGYGANVTINMCGCSAARQASQPQYMAPPRPEKPARTVTRTYKPEPVRSVTPGKPVASIPVRGGGSVPAPACAVGSSYPRATVTSGVMTVCDGEFGAVNVKANDGKVGSLERPTTGPYIWHGGVLTVKGYEHKGSHAGKRIAIVSWTRGDASNGCDSIYTTEYNDRLCVTTGLFGGVKKIN